MADGREGDGRKKRKTGRQADRPWRCRRTVQYRSWTTSAEHLGITGRVQGRRTSPEATALERWLANAPKTRAGCRNYCHSVTAFSRGRIGLHHKVAKDALRKHYNSSARSLTSSAASNLVLEMTLEAEARPAIGVGAVPTAVLGEGAVAYHDKHGERGVCLWQPHVHVD